jgi:hypothetical protein
MSLDIDITDLQSREIAKILNMYPQGHLKINFERVFWCSDYVEPSNADYPTSPAKAFDPRRPARGSGNIGESFGRMSDTLAGMVQPPQRERRN